MSLDLAGLVEKYGVDEVRHILALQSGYARRVPTIDEFLDSPEFLGSVETGSCVIDIFPVWRTALQELFPNPYKCSKKEVLLAAAIGSGKTTTALIAAAYDTCRVLCLNDPHKYLGTGKIKALTVACVNRSRDLAKAVLYDQLVLLFKESPFFIEKMKDAKKAKATTLFPNNVDVIYGSRGNQILGTDIFCAVLSELAFSNTTKKQAYDVYTNALRRFRSRFMFAKSKYGLYPGRMYIDSSMADEDSFVNSDFLKGKQLDEECTVLLYPYWEIHGFKEGLYCGRTFPVFIGDFENDPVIIDDNIADYDQSKVLEVPVEHKKEFEDDLISSLQDIANVLTKSTSSWLPGSIGIDLATSIPCGKDILQLQKGVDLAIPYTPEPTDAPRFIGLDLSKTGDKTGVAISYIKGFKESKSVDGAVVRTPLVRTEFAIAIKNAKSSEIPIGELRDWLIGLHTSGTISIELVTADQFQSAVVIQDLNAAGITAELLSVDRTTIPYDTLRSNITQGTWELPDSPLLRQELKNLEMVKQGRTNKLKVDHPLGTYTCPETQRILPHSKDVADAVTQSGYSAITHSAEGTITGGAISAYFEYVTEEAPTKAHNTPAKVDTSSIEEQVEAMDLSEEEYADLMDALDDQDIADG